MLGGALEGDNAAPAAGDAAGDFYLGNVVDPAMIGDVAIIGTRSAS
jgi:hypothetical protein